MKNLIIISSLIVLVFLSCSTNNEQKENNVEENLDTIRIQDDSTSSKEVLVESNINNKGPIKYFIDLTDTLDELGWSSDTARLNNVPIYSMLEYENLKLFNNRPFYKIDITNCEIFRYEKHNNYRVNLIDFELFRKAKDIWGYFYRIDNEDNYITDGVIEQWEFEDETMVKSAIGNLKLVYPLPYFNTSPYYHQVDNYLFIFHTRASNFSYNQKDIYEKFKIITSSN